jgi:anaerobic magnesium-protoporphyrin IX monomethyl ester cyclase
VKKKILLVKPPEKASFNFGTFSLGVLAAAVKNQADVSIIDATDYSLEYTVNQIFLQEPDILGITAMGLPSIKPIELLILHFLNRKRKIKNSFPVKIIVGGHGASMAYNNLLKSGADIVVIGEGELTLQQIVKNGIKPGEPGTACMEGRKIVVGPKQKLIRPLDLLPLPARDMMPLPPDGVHLMETSRGCPHDCGFCETTRFYKKLWRPFSASRVVNEVLRLINDYNAWIIHFADDNFAANPKRVIEICQRLKKEQLPALIMASARADDLISSEDIIPSMASANILRISVGVETLEPEISKNIKKNITREEYKKAFHLMRKHGIFSVASFIIGLPGEKPDMRQRALDLAIEVAPDSAHFLPFLPLPSLPINLSQNLFDPNSEDIRDASELTLQFHKHKTTRQRLHQAVKQGGIRELLAQAVLDKG